MKILQVVTYISPDGAYGGPVRVALNQAKALTGLGHEVVVAGAAGGFAGDLPTSYDGFPVRLFPGRRVVPGTGFAGLTAPGLLKWLPKALRRSDVTHVHMSRDLVTLPSAAMAVLAQQPLVVQAHGMIDPTNKASAKPLDALLTVPVLKAASTVLHLTAKEKSDLEAVTRSELATRALPNGVHVPAIPAIEQNHGPVERPEVLCLARIHSIKRPLTFVGAGLALAAQQPEARFSLVGPDEGEGASVAAVLAGAGNPSAIQWQGPVAPHRTTERLRRASVFALPSASELFSMSTLEAMAVGLPVVITETSGLADLVRDRNAGIVCSLSQESFNDALARLLGDPGLRRGMGANGRRAVEELYSIDQMGRDLASVYGVATEGDES
ncbi:glycosyltransferase [Kocuria arenosa]|uniref:glycosyltransferase n=1 Tax=Kocuria arenosa TaxID=3071446 RepID=UPI0034D73269